MKKLILSFSVLFVICLNSFGQTLDLPASLKIDTSFAYLQFYSNSTFTKLANHFKNVKNDKLVILHYGGSHIQAENPTTIARGNFHKTFGSGGRGLMFNYSAANTYSSVNYASSKKGEWKFIKSFQGRHATIPLGVCGMTVETNDVNAALNFNLKNVIESDNHEVVVFFENDSISFDVSIYFDSVLIDSVHNNLQYFPYGASFKYKEGIHSIRLEMKAKANGKRFRFYGLSVENEENSGIVYHSTGVGAAAFRSVLLLDKMPDQAAILKPDIVILDFGTNDILSTNKIDPNLEKQVNKAIAKFKAVNPEILVILTTTQDLYKGKTITACMPFRDLMDSIARKNDCLFWDWFDLAGGSRTIKTWNSEGYAQNDCIHLTKKGYQVKVQLLFESFMHTLNLYDKNPYLSAYNIKGKEYPFVEPTPIIPDTSRNAYPNVIHSDSIPKVDSIPPRVITPPVRTERPIVKPRTKKYTVRSGDTLSQIAARNRTTVARIKKANRLRSDRLSIGQVLVIPN